MKRTIVVLFVMLSSCRGERAGGARVQILVNHVGYETSGAKRAVIQSDGEVEVSACAVKLVATEKSVLDVTPKRVGAVAKWKTWRYWTADFDGATGEGDYFVECTANGRGV